MTFEQMKQTLVDIELLEKDLMRELTADEKDYIAENGWKAFLDSVVDSKDYKLLLRAKKVLAAVFNDTFDELIENGDWSDVADLFREIADDISNTEDVEKSEPDALSIYKHKLIEALDGTTVKMSDEEFSDFCDFLDQEMSNYCVRNVNGNVTVKAL